MKNANRDNNMEEGNFVTSKTKGICLLISLGFVFAFIVIFLVLINFFGYNAIEGILGEPYFIAYAIGYEFGMFYFYLTLLLEALIMWIILLFVCINIFAMKRKV